MIRCDFNLLESFTLEVLLQLMRLTCKDTPFHYNMAVLHISATRSDLFMMMKSHTMKSRLRHAATMRSSVWQYEYCLSAQVCLPKRMYCEMQFKTLGHCFVCLLQKISLEGKLQAHAKKKTKKKPPFRLPLAVSVLFSFLLFSLY